jgi:hypothetical protein
MTSALTFEAVMLARGLLVRNGSNNKRVFAEAPPAPGMMTEKQE